MDDQYPNFLHLCLIMGIFNGQIIGGISDVFNLIKMGRWCYRRWQDHWVEILWEEQILCRHRMATVQTHQNLYLAEPIYLGNFGYWTILSFISKYSLRNFILDCFLALLFWNKIKNKKCLGWLNEALQDVLAWSLKGFFMIPLFSS